MEFFSKSKKFKKYFKSDIKNKINRFPSLHFGKFGLQTIRPVILKIEHLKLCLQILKKFLKPFGKLIKIRLRVFPDVGITKKPKDIRMGRGKGLVIYNAKPLKAGSVIFELVNIEEETAKRAINLCLKKLPGRNKFISSSDY